MLSEAQKSKLYAMRKAMDIGVGLAAEKGAKYINDIIEMIRLWKPGAFVEGDIRAYNGIPYKCIQDHDTTKTSGEPPDKMPELWMQYHGTNRETARPWIQPTGAQDAYLVDEWMIYTNNTVYKCVSKTQKTPEDSPESWKAQVTNN